MRRDPLDRFADKVALSETGCLLWLACTNTKGYGLFRVGDHRVMAHRWYYEYAVGPIPDGLQLDHLCRVRNCVLPVHLEPVTGAVNRSRGIGPKIVSLRHRPDQSKCGSGLHDWVEENIYRHPSGDRCKPCNLSRP